jgi:hypothetical protein
MESSGKPTQAWQVPSWDQRRAASSQKVTERIPNRRHLIIREWPIWNLAPPEESAGYFVIGNTPQQGRGYSHFSHSRKTDLTRTRSRMVRP